MDQNQKQKSLIKSQFLKRGVTKLVLSVSVFSLFFSHSTLLLSFLHYLNLYLSTLPFKLFSHTLDKNCTFLLCNGLLVFLANYSGLFSLSSSSPSSSSSSSSPSSSSSSSKHNLKDHHNESFLNYEHPQITIMETKHHHHYNHQVQLLLEQEAELENAQTQQKQNPMQPENDEKEKSEAVETEAEHSVEENHEEQQQEEEDEEEEARAVLGEAEADSEAESRFFIEEIDDEEEQEEGEGGNGKLSDEELNKKFEDFIRKMKEELRIEARQKLIMV